MKSLIFQKLKQEYSHLGLGMEVLQAHADALAATGLVTAENVDTIVSSQASFLESIQKANDKRVTDAQKKAKEDARKEFEVADAEAKKRAEEEAARKALEGQMPDWYKREKEAQAASNSAFVLLRQIEKQLKDSNDIYDQIYRLYRIEKLNPAQIAARVPYSKTSVWRKIKEINKTIKGEIENV